MPKQATVYVPKGAAAERLGIDPRSGIVGRPASPSLVELYYEGNRFGASNIVTFADRCWHAFDRMDRAYPTVARSLASVEDVIDAGTFTVGHGVDPHDGAALAALAGWLELDFPAGEWGDRLHTELRLDGGRR